MRGFFLFFVIFPLLAADSFRELPVIRLPGMNGCNALAVSKNYLYAAGGQELVTYEIGEDPLTPRITSRIPVAGARQIALSGDWIFISARHFGIHVLDRRNPAKPLPVSRIEPIELATGIQACGNILFVSLRVYGVELIDVSDPQHPRHLSLLRNCGEIQSLFCYGEGFLAMGDWGGKALRIADVRNPLQPREVSRVNLDGYGDGVWVQRNFCYASTGHHSRARDPEKRFGTGHGLEIFDLSNPGNPVHVSTIKFPPFYELGDDFWTVRVDRGIAYAGDTFNGMFMVDVRDPRNPKCIGRALLPRAKRYSSFRKKTIEEPDCVMDLAIGNNAVYLAGPRTGVFAVPTKSKISTPPAVALSIPERSACREISNLKLHAMDVNVRSLTLWRNDHLFVSCSEGGLFLFRIEGNDLKLLRAWRDKNVYETAVSGQILFAAGLALYMANFSGEGTGVWIPFLDKVIDFGWLYVPFIAFVVVAMANSVNLTDGLDGLSSGVTFIVAMFFAIAGQQSSQGEAAIFSAILAGACLGFLMYNRFPAKLFMGDTGSMALGGALASAAIMMKLEFLLVIAGFIYVAEALSVIIQVVSFKLTGKRVFRMAPLHHHFEMGGMKETQVVTMFWAAALVLCLLAYAVFRI